jgi:hypothetical protein
MIKVRIKEEYKGRMIYVGGNTYDFNLMTQEQLSIIWNEQPRFRPFLEEVVHLEDDTILTPSEFDEAIKKTIKSKRRK